MDDRQRLIVARRIALAADRQVRWLDGEHKPEHTRNGPKYCGNVSHRDLEFNNIPGLEELPDTVPKVVFGSVMVVDTPLTTLKNLPSKIIPKVLLHYVNPDDNNFSSAHTYSSLSIAGTNIRDLTELPGNHTGKMRIQDINLSRNRRLTSLAGIPKETLTLQLHGCERLTSLEHVPSHILELDISGSGITNATQISSRDNVRQLFTLWIESFTKFTGIVSLLSMPNLSTINFRNDVDGPMAVASELDAHILKNLHSLRHAVATSQMNLREAQLRFSRVLIGAGAASLI